MYYITNTVQYNPKLHHEADYAECTAWYTVDHVLTMKTQRKLHINLKKTKVMHLNLTEPHPHIMIDAEELIWEATLMPRTVFRRISQVELTKQETVIATSITYKNQTYIT